MAFSLNKVMIIGHLGRDPEIRSFPSGGKIATLRVATSETWKDRNTGERKERTEWVSVTINNEGLVKVAEQYLRKGSFVYLEGKLETRKWQDQSGQDRYSTEVVLRAFNGELGMLDKKPDSQSGAGGYGYGGGYNDYQAPDPNQRSYGDQRGERSHRNDLDEEIPF